MARVRRSKTNNKFFTDIVHPKEEPKKEKKSLSTTPEIEVMPTPQELTKSVMTLLREKMELKAEHRVLWEQSSEIRKKLYNVAQKITEKEEVIEDNMIKWDASNGGKA